MLVASASFVNKSRVNSVFSLFRFPWVSVRMDGTEGSEANFGFPLVSARMETTGLRGPTSLRTLSLVEPASLHADRSRQSIEDEVTLL